MRKTIFLIAGTVLALVSCSNDETTGINNGNAIDFRVAMGTRATETTTANMTNFFVTAIDANKANYFNNAEFEKNGGFFTSTPVYYWPTDGSDLSFYAYSPSATDLGAAVSITDAAKTLTDFAPKAAIAEQKDFATANATGNKTNQTTGVALTFAHRLAQIEVKAKNANTGYVYKVKGVRIGKPVSKASFDFGTSLWMLSTEKANYEVTYTSERTLGEDVATIMTTATDNAMLIPQQLVAWNADKDKTNNSNGAYLAALVQITTASGARVYPAAAITAGYDWVAVPVNTNWVAGNKYIYTLDFSNGAGKVDPEKPKPTEPGVDPFNPGDDVLGGAIKFTVNVTPWEDAAQSDTEM